jgi:hypothetical protein
MDKESYPGEIRERRFADFEREGRGQRAALFTAGFGLVLFLFVLALSARQSTSEGTANRVLESGISSITEVDLVLAERAEEIRQLATGGSPSFAVPGYPLAVRISREEAALPRPQLRAIILQRSAALVYTQGLHAFDTTGKQSLGIFSAEGALRLAAGQLSEESNDRATTATLVLAVLMAALAALVLVRGEGYGRLRALGVAILVGAAPGVLLAVLVRLGVGRVGGDDPFMADLQSILAALVSVVLRNFIVMTVLGVVLTVSPVVMRLVEERVVPRFVAPRAFDEWGDDEFEDPGEGHSTT